MSRFTLSISHVDTCLPCYVNDHCNGDDEALFGVSVDSSSRVYHVRDNLISEIQLFGDSDKIPEDISDAMVADCVREAFNGSHPLKAWDSSLEKACEDGQESAYAWFRLTWEEIETDEAPASRATMVPQPAQQAQACAMSPEHDATLREMEADLLSDPASPLSRALAAPVCELCRANTGESVPATYRAVQSHDAGQTISHVLICEAHANGWNDGGDWEAPIVPLAMVLQQVQQQQARAVPSPELVAAYRYHRQHKLNFAASDPRARSDGRRAETALSFARLDVASGKPRYPTLSDAWNSKTPDRSGKRWIESPADCGLRFVGYADKLNRHIDHTGWYSDDFQDSKIRGVVYQMSSRDGRPVYISGHDNEDNGAADCGGPAYLDFSTLHYGDKGGTWAENNGDASDAASMADSFAERHAETERDYQEAWQAGSRYVDLGTEYREQRHALREALIELRAATRENYRATLVRASVLATFAESRCKLLAKRHRLFAEYGNTDAFRDHLPETN